MKYKIKNQIITIDLYNFRRRYNVHIDGRKCAFQKMLKVKLKAIIEYFNSLAWYEWCAIDVMCTIVDDDILKNIIADMYQSNLFIYKHELRLKEKAISFGWTE